MIKSRVYVGVCKKENTTSIPFERKVFKTIYNPPSRLTHPEYCYVIGPFKTVRAAKWCADHPHSMCQTVKEFEHAALVHQTQSELCKGYIKHLDKQ